MKEFNTEGLCVSDMHYMVNTHAKLENIIKFIDSKKYFTINRSRQYGKTTTLVNLKKTLKNKYQIISISFEGIGEEPFSSNAAFTKTFIELCYDAFRTTNINDNDAQIWLDTTNFDYEKPIRYLSKKISVLCKKYDIVLMVDEMDKCSENQVFLNFLGMLREKYLSRTIGEDFTFRSVILAGVYDVKNLKLKLRSNEETRYNSPWNIAADFNVDMSFNPQEISTMLIDYENDVHTGMNIKTISEEIYHYTNGYPYLVSWICKWIEEQGNRNWTINGIQKAVKNFYDTDSTLKDDLIKNYENNPTLNSLIDDMLIKGKSYAYVSTDEAVSIGRIFGIFSKTKDNERKLMISNIIFEHLLLEHALMKFTRSNIEYQPEKKQFIKQDGTLDMVLVLNRFQALMKSEYRKEDDKFIESQGRLLFLCFIKPIINGTGFYYVEPQTRSNSRMDIVVTYHGEEFIIELKIWHGNQYRKDGIKQLNAYLDSREQTNGYLISFSFLQNKEYFAGYINDVTNIDAAEIENKKIYEVIV